MSNSHTAEGNASFFPPILGFRKVLYRPSMASHRMGVRPKDEQEGTIKNNTNNNKQRAYKRPTNNHEIFADKELWDFDDNFQP